MPEYSSRNREIRDSETNPREREIRYRGQKLVISDDRAKEIELIDPVTISLFGTFKSDAQVDKLKNVRNRANVKSIRMQKITYPFYMAILIITIFAVMYAFIVSIGSSVSSPFSLLLFVLACYTCWQGCRAMTRGLRIQNARRIMNAMMKEGLCLSCAYDICGLQTDTDSCVVCPECGCAWRITAAATTSVR